MLTIDTYAVNHLTILLMGERTKYGYLYTRVIEEKLTFLVRMTPREVLEHTLTSVGSDLKGAIKSARSILGNGYMYPIIVNPYQEICMFPTHSPSADHCIWINPKHIVNADKKGSQTITTFSNYIIMPIDLGHQAFSTKRYQAHRLLESTKENGHKVRVITSENQKYYQVIREDNGIYNFDIFKDMEN
ncbi:competence protein ComK [Cytobacillus gottheilii]|uniref:competence protein ComK n=1 Tax=Cytobacillus gottheilii TaxID=859144 RepID=UPI0009BB5A60|nr:competence protein ComK [Cytobacillus gottheilii]